MPALPASDWSIVTISVTLQVLGGHLTNPVPPDHVLAYCTTRFAVCRRLLRLLGVFTRPASWAPGRLYPTSLLGSWASLPDQPPGLLDVFTRPASWAPGPSWAPGRLYPTSYPLPRCTWGGVIIMAGDITSVRSRTP
eukprot:1195708-Prorocentrum_minimum.AAC.7